MTQAKDVLITIGGVTLTVEELGELVTDLEKLKRQFKNAKEHVIELEDMIESQERIIDDLKKGRR